MSFFDRRKAQSDLTHPTTIHAIKSKTLEKEQVEKYVDGFLKEYEDIVNSTSGPNSSSDVGYYGPRATKISQLKRLQRELRGLPPLIMDEEPGSEVKQNKKIVFDDESIGETVSGTKTVFDDQPKYVEESEDSEDDEDSEEKEETAEKEVTEEKEVIEDDIAEKEPKEEEIVKESKKRKTDDSTKKHHKSKKGKKSKKED
ncbi:DEKNAAC103138 [Brettanomyces naardenensis]|uniref:DEKNAAC103138 n=1 Tax=Brettanomyces naardenensis TaxID=13370 RepID=A0A448YMM4_BRENA|nr:DEKNAAC103138 [Brettanomyces naardenensis]